MDSAILRVREFIILLRGGIWQSCSSSSNTVVVVVVADLIVLLKEVTGIYGKVEAHYTEHTN